MRRVGSLLIVAGVLTLGWMAWTLFSPSGEPITSYLQHREQAHLRHTLKGNCNTRAREGQAVGVIRIPSIHVTQVVVQGTADDDLALGPGHYRGSGWPGGGRAVAVAGHRTTHGAPFRRLDAVRRGDLVQFCGANYRVTGQRVVRPSNTSVLWRRWEMLVLTTCTPPHSAEYRLVVFARPA